MSGPTMQRDVECPECKARLTFRRAKLPQFDSSGFEYYELECENCRALLHGIIDPYDGTVFLSSKGSPVQDAR